MDTVRLPRDTNGTSIEVPILDYDRTVMSAIWTGRTYTNTNPLDRGLYLIQLYGAPCWVKEVDDEISSPFNPGMIMFPGEKVIYITPGKHLAFSNQGEFGRDTNNEEIIIGLVPLVEA